MPDILYIDNDEPGYLAVATPEQRERVVMWQYGTSPMDEVVALAAAANVWLLDFFLVEEGLQTGPDENGLSLFQKLKKRGERPPTVLISGHLEQAIGEHGKVERRHVFAQRHGVEWIGDKGDEGQTMTRLIAMADAVARIDLSIALQPGEDGALRSYDPKELATGVLGVPAEAEWAGSALRQIDRARPPRELPSSSSAAKARPIVGWLIANVLPYPTFLLTDAQAALRFRLAADWLRTLVDCEARETDLGQRLAACIYRGPLADFLGRRWWRAAVDALAWELSQEEGGLRGAVDRRAGKADVEWLGQSEPVLVYDADLVETEVIADASECVRVTDEDFPANVDPAWVRLSDAQEDRQLAAKVVFEDRALLSDEA